jgi:hypothetical protein
MMIAELIFSLLSKGIPAAIEAIRASQATDAEKAALLARLSADLDLAKARVAAMEIRDV